MEKTSKNQEVRPFGWRDKVGYMFGDFGNDFTFLLSSIYLMKFYTDVMGVSARAIGNMMMLARIVDAFTDIGMGRLVDKSPAGKDGKFKQWIRRFMGPVALASFLMYANRFKDMSLTFKTVWMFVTYLLWGSICYTGVNIPYGSMASAITDDPDQRTQLSSFRTIGATLAQMIIGVVAPTIVYYTNKAGIVEFDGARMALFALICSVGALVCYILCLKLTTERVKIEKEADNSSMGQIFKGMFSSRSLIGIIIAAILLLLAMLTINGMANYVYPSYFKSAKGISESTLISTVLTFVLSALVPKISAKIGKKESATLGSIISGVALIIAYTMKVESMQTWMVFFTFASIGMATFNILVWAMIIDVIDDIEVRTGSRDDGTIYGSYSFARKLGQAASSGLIGNILDSLGYVDANSVTPEIAQGIFRATTLIPGVIFLALALVLAFVYPLSKKVVDANSEELRRRREN